MNDSIKISIFDPIEDPAFIVHSHEGHEYKIFASGRVEGFGGAGVRIYNRIPALMTQYAKEALAEYGK